VPGVVGAVGGLVLLVLVTAWATWRPGSGSAAAVALAAVLWWLLDKPVEGPVLLTVTPTHGLTLADLLPVASAGLLLVRLLVRRAG
jgi:hypothetical protein